jgi:hypothetical protein
MSNSTNGTIEISKAMIGCIGAVLAAIIGGVFLLISTGVIQIGISSPNTRGNILPSSPQSIEVAQEVGNQLPIPPTLPPNPTKPPTNASCPVILLDGNGGPVTSSTRWIEIERSWSVTEPISYDIKSLCSRRSDNIVHMLIGTTTSPYDDVSDRGYFTLDQARGKIEENKGKPMIIIPW